MPRRDARDILALVIDNHLSPAHPYFNPKSTLSPSSHSDRPLCAEERAITNSHSEPTILSRSPSLFSSFPSLLRSPPTPATFFSLFHHRPDFLGELSLFLLLFLCLFLSFSRVLDSHILDPGSLSLSRSLPTSLLSRLMHPAFLVIRGYLIPHEWKRRQEE